MIALPVPGTDTRVLTGRGPAASSRTRAASSRSNATSVPEFQISPAAISPGTDASGTYSIRSTSVVSVGSPILSGSFPTNTTCSESTMPTIG